MQDKIDLPSEVLLTSIEELNLSSRARNSLIRQEVKILGQVIELGYWGMLSLSQVGEKQADEIVRAVSEYCHIPVEVIKQYGINVQLRVEVQEGERPNLILLIVPLTKALLDAYNDQRGFKFLRYYYGLDGGEMYILRDIGDAEGLSRERIRQINERNMRRLNSILLNTGGMNDKIVPGILVSEATDLYKVFSDQEGILLEQEILELIRERYNYTVEQKELNNLKFLLNVFDFKELAQRPQGYSGSKIKAWQIDNSLEIEKIWQALSILYKILYSVVIPLSAFELKMQINRHRKKKVEDHHILYAIKICPDIEIIGDDNYQLKFEQLSSIADQAYRVLLESGKPLHYREILREINHRLVVAGFLASGQHRSLIGQMVTNPKFEAIGRSGKWKLREWDSVETQITVDIMKEFLHLKKNSATINEIHSYVVQKRSDIPKQSVIAYLYQKDDFIRVSPSQYALAAWGDKPVPKKSIEKPILSMDDRLAPTVKDILGNTEDRKMLLNELVQGLQVRTNIRSGNIYNWLNKSPLVKIEPAPGYSRKKVVQYVGGASEDSELPKKKTVMKTVQEEIDKYLRQQPDKKALVADVYVHVKKVTGCRKQTFYNYLSRMENVKKNGDSRKLYCSLDEKSHASQEQMDFPQLSQVTEEYLRENILRAVGLLNVNTVDMGLFQLGKIFENELKKFLLLAQQKNTFKVSNNDLARLVNMIDCVVREGIIQKKNHLTFLREERNERAHGAIPQKSEREELMRYAQSWSGLYLDYIIIFHQEWLKIQSR